MTKRRFTVIRISVAVLTAAVYSAVLFMPFLSADTVGRALIIAGGAAAAAAAFAIAHFSLRTKYYSWLEEENQKRRFETIDAISAAREDYWGGQKGYDEDLTADPYADDLMTREQARELGLEELYLQHLRPRKADDSSGAMIIQGVSSE